MAGKNNLDVLLYGAPCGIGYVDASSDSWTFRFKNGETITTYDYDQAVAIDTVLKDIGNGPENNETRPLLVVTDKDWSPYNNHFTNNGDKFKTWKKIIFEKCVDIVKNQKNTGERYWLYGFQPDPEFWQLVVFDYDQARAVEAARKKVGNGFSFDDELELIYPNGQIEQFDNYHDMFECWFWKIFLPQYREEYDAIKAGVASGSQQQSATVTQDSNNGKTTYTLALPNGETLITEDPAEADRYKNYVNTYYECNALAQQYGLTPPEWAQFEAGQGSEVLAQYKTLAANKTNAQQEDDDGFSIPWWGWALGIGALTGAVYMLTRKKKRK